MGQDHLAGALGDQAQHRLQVLVVEILEIVLEAVTGVLWAVAALAVASVHPAPLPARPRARC